MRPDASYLAGFAGMTWLAECSAEALGEALLVVAPELACIRSRVSAPDPAAQADPLYWSSSTVVGERYIAKFAWSRPAALRLAIWPRGSAHSASTPTRCIPATTLGPVTLRSEARD